MSTKQRDESWVDTNVLVVVPDYYAEKVGSVQGYRQWLKDQRAFNKKRQTFVK